MNISTSDGTAYTAGAARRTHPQAKQEGSPLGRVQGTPPLALWRGTGAMDSKTRTTERITAGAGEMYSTTGAGAAPMRRLT